MQCSKILISNVIAIAMYALPAVADTRVTTIESQVRAIPSESTTVYKIVGPEQTEYRIQAPPAQLGEIATVIKQNPSSVVQFDGDVTVDETGNKVFRVTKWKKTTTVNEHSDTPVTERTRTETRTETIR